MPLRQRVVGVAAHRVFRRLQRDLRQLRRPADERVDRNGDAGRDRDAEVCARGGYRDEDRRRSEAHDDQRRAIAYAAADGVAISPRRLPKASPSHLNQRCSAA